jgi:hypothetical protein
MNCDEMTTLENQSWLSILAYVVEQWRNIPILLNLQHVMDEATFDNLTHLIVKNLVMFEGLNETKVANKLVYFGAKGVIIFQGLDPNVTT